MTIDIHSAILYDPDISIQILYGIYGDADYVLRNAYVFYDTGELHFLNYENIEQGIYSSWKLSSRKFSSPKDIYFQHNWKIHNSKYKILPYKINHHNQNNNLLDIYPNTITTLFEYRATDLLLYRTNLIKIVSYIYRWGELFTLEKYDDNNCTYITTPGVFWRIKPEDIKYHKQYIHAVHPSIYHTSPPIQRLADFI